MHCIQTCIRVVIHLPGCSCRRRSKTWDQGVHKRGCGILPSPLASMPAIWRPLYMYLVCCVPLMPESPWCRTGPLDPAICSSTLDSVGSQNRQLSQLRRYSWKVWTCSTGSHNHFIWTLGLPGKELEVALSNKVPSMVLVGSVARSMLVLGVMFVCCTCALERLLANIESWEASKSKTVDCGVSPSTCSTWQWGQLWFVGCVESKTRVIRDMCVWRQPGGHAASGQGTVQCCSSILASGYR
jgi:hypothetical protein